MSQTAYLVLENGKTFRGLSFGADGAAAGEVVFTTGMTGYMRTLTDPCYSGQIVAQTFPLIGNSGVITGGAVPDGSHAAAYIVKEWCREPSNFQSEGDLDAFLRRRGIVGLEGIDTRALTKCLREQGVMRGCIVPDPACADFSAPSARTSGAKGGAPYLIGGGNAKRAAAIDFGYVAPFAGELASRGWEVTVFPPDAEARDIIAASPGGVLLSDGPADGGGTDAVKELLNAKIPLFGVGLGHILMARAYGLKTERLKYGHRGENLPVRDMSSGKVYITSQNHPEAVCELRPGLNAKALFVNVNDNTDEGLEYLDAPAFSANFRPGGRTAFLYGRFIRQMEVNANAAG